MEVTVIECLRPCHRICQKVRVFLVAVMTITISATGAFATDTKQENERATGTLLTISERELGDIFIRASFFTKTEIAEGGLLARKGGKIYNNIYLRILKEYNDPKLGEAFVTKGNDNGWIFSSTMYDWNDEEYECFDVTGARRVRGCDELLSSIQAYNVAVSDEYLSRAYGKKCAGYADQWKLGRALTQCNKSIQVDPASPMAYARRGSLYRSLGNIKYAMSDYDKAIQLAPQNASIFNQRSWALFKLGKLIKALEDANRAVELSNPDDYMYYTQASILDTRAHIHEALGHKNQAIADYRQALEIHPRLDISKRGLIRLGVTE